MVLDALRRRSVAFLRREDQSWACFLVTYQEGSGRWRGYFSFRSQEGDPGDEEVRTADIFVEESEQQIDRKARGLGKPLLSGLLSSALERHQDSSADPGHLRRWFRSYLKSNSREVAGSWEEDGSPAGERGTYELRSIYDSYRLDQVAHFITLIDSEDFREAVGQILAGETFDFGAKDRLQFAMMVVDFIESRLPLPPFDVWLEDYLAHTDQYRLYTHTLHREGRLP